MRAFDQSAFAGQPVLLHVAEGRGSSSLPPGNMAIRRIIYAARSASLRFVYFCVATGIASGFGYALGLAAALGVIFILNAAKARPDRPPVAAARPSGFDPSRFILNALLVPALDSEALPFRWADPRPPLGCGSNAVVRVNRKPLRVGALVPDAPFELDWRTDGCRPFGASGPRFDGRVKLTVFREDWGFSAMVEPHDLRVAFAEGETTWIQPGSAWMAQCVGAERRTGQMSMGANQPLPCR